MGAFEWAVFVLGAVPVLYGAYLIQTKGSEVRRSVGLGKVEIHTTYVGVVVLVIGAVLIILILVPSFFR